MINKYTCNNGETTNINFDRTTPSPAWQNSRSTATNSTASSILQKQHSVYTMLYRDIQSKTTSISSPTAHKTLLINLKTNGTHPLRNNNPLQKHGNRQLLYLLQERQPRSRLDSHGHAPLRRPLHYAEGLPASNTSSSGRYHEGTWHQAQATQCHWRWRG